MKRFIVVGHDGTERSLMISSYSYTSAGFIEMFRDGQSAGVVAPGFRIAYYAESGEAAA